MELLRDPDELKRLLAQNAREPMAYDTREWLSNPSNFALREGEDVGLFEAMGEWPGPLDAHVFFASRGAQALTIAKAMLAQAFAYGATEIHGETPAKFRDALMFSRLLGFKVVGERETPDGKVILSLLLPTHFA
jgi:hypothetical protein